LALNQPPVGTVTFLFTDIEGSTKLWQQHPDSMNQALARHHDLLKESIVQHGGYMFQIIGDAFCSAFATANDGLDAALEAQRALLAEDWGEIGSLRVRMALHTGKAEIRIGEYKTGEYTSSLTLSHTSRLLSAGYGGQILLSSATVGLLSERLPDGVVLRDLGSRRLKDLAQSERLFQVVTEDLPVDFPPLKAPEYWPNNLPAQLTSFVGREKELVAVQEHLQQQRLVTLTGAGGCGKTRLALQAASELLTGFIDGVWFIELASIHDSNLVAQAVASVLSLRSESDHPPLEGLVAYLREKNVLLVLDNCEHLVEACARLVEGILHECPKVTIMTTSREALNISGEINYRVPSLSLPASKLSAMEGLMKSEAGRLFVERAGSILPGYSVTPINSTAIAQICRSLDGIPLAIELAAARINILRAEQIAARLADVFQLLTAGKRTELPRHQTLRATMDWSYRLLDESEKILLQRLAVFAGGWTLDAAEEICSGYDMPANGCEVSEKSVAIASGVVLDYLSHLVDKSLVNLERSQSEVARYTLFETIRQFAKEEQLKYGETAWLRGKHLDFYRKLAEKAEPEIHGWDQSAWLRKLDVELPNLRLALEWSLEVDPRAGLSMAASLADFWDTHGYFAEGRMWLEKCLAATRSEPPDRLRLKAMTGYLELMSRQITHIEEYISAIDETLSLATILQDKLGLSQALRSKAQILAFQGESPEKVQEVEQQSLQLMRETENRRGIGQALGQLAARSLKRYDYQQAIAIFTESLAMFEEVGDQREIAGALWNLAEVHLARGDYSLAQLRATESLARYQELSDRHGIATTLRSLAKVAFNLGEQGQARSQVEESVSLFKELGDVMCLTDTELILGRVCLAMDNISRAERLAQACFNKFSANGFREEMVQALLLLGRTLLQRGESNMAAQHYREGITLSREIGNLGGSAPLLEGLARLSVINGDTIQAARLFGEAQRLRDQKGGGIDRDEQAERTLGMQAARALLGEEKYKAEFARGMSNDHLIENIENRNQSESS
jgi:predicted ATPase/class 3 adenylate cyclase